ncbi:MAG: InlB B-repeat-containing protein [Eubacteriales bacterium]|nr:InlB B-repeat-containing protein [Eubacteriales bacterium]MDY4208337.1 InlB B-repeat-containing protein [Lachnospiraceae bacterium]
MKKRILSILLTICMVLMLLPTTVFADSAAAEQFKLTPGGTYWFDLSGVNIPGTVNRSVPDTTLHYVPFTYAGTVDAYKLSWESEPTEEVAEQIKYPHSLFVADYAVKNFVSWNELDTAGLIFGKSYTGGSVDYTLRAPSAGSQYTGSGDSRRGTPPSNEWDMVLNKNSDYIKNWNLMYSWGQDTVRNFPTYRVLRGSRPAGYWESHPADSSQYVALGFRPFLEVLNVDTLGSDGLKAATLDLNGGKLGGSTDSIQIIVKNGAAFTAPVSDGLTRPDGDTGDYFKWLGSDGKLYAPGGSVPAGVTTLTAQWTDTYTVTLNTNGGTIASGKDVTEYTYGTGAALPTAADINRDGFTFGGWYEDANFSGSPVTEISATDTGKKEFYAKWSILEQFNLTPGGTYWFDLSGENIPGTVNSSVPDTTLHYVPFTYAGTVDAYKLTSAMAITEDYAEQYKYYHSLFVADYAVTRIVSWDALNTVGLIFGRSYTGGSVDYTLRAPSVGSNTIGSEDTRRGTPQSNEWDMLLDKNSGYIQNWNGMYSLGQDTEGLSSASTVSPAIRGNAYARFWSYCSASYPVASVGYRPVLEVLNTDTLGSDGLKAVTLDLNGGKLGGSTENIQIIVRNGAAFTAPPTDGLTRPDGDTGNYFKWLGSDGKLYAPGDSVPAGVATLTAQWTPDTYTVTLNTNGGSIANGKNVTEYTYGTGATLPTAGDITRDGYTFEGWYEDNSFSGSPVTEISATDMGKKEFYAKWVITEQFNLTPGATYWFDLSGETIPGTVNTGNSSGAASVPDTTLHYVPFTYAGTVDAYKLISEMATTVDYATQNKYPHSLFVADYPVTHTVSWNELNTAGLIFGRSYIGGRVDYTLRAPSGGSGRTGSGDSELGTPQSNEWDVVLDKNSGYIKNWGGMYSRGQDTVSNYRNCRAARGFTSARRFSEYVATARYANAGFRPVLEVLSTDTLGSDGLKAVTLDLNGGKLGGSTENIQIVVKNGAAFTAPASDGLTAPTGYNATGFKWQHSDGNLYAPGDSVPADVTTLTAKWTPDTYTVTLNKNGGSIANDKDVTEYTYGTGAALPTADDITRDGFIFEGWYEDNSFSGSPVTEISAAATGKKAFYAKWKSKADAGLSVGTVPEKTYGDEAFKLDVHADSDGKVTYSSDNANTATVDENGTVTIHQAGTATLTIRVAETATYLPGEVTVTITVVCKNATLTVDKLTYNVTCGDADFIIGYASEGESRVTFTSSNEKVATVDKNGVVHIVSAGSTTITLNMEQSGNYNAVSKKVEVIVSPKAITATDDNQTKPDNTATGTSPQTGDSTILWIWFMLLFASCGGVITTIYIGKRKKDKAE